MTKLVIVSMGYDGSLPEGFELLSSEDIADLIQQGKLKEYVKRFNPTNELINEVLVEERRLQELVDLYEELEARRSEYQKDLEKSKLIEARYVKLWQDHMRHWQSNYSDEALKKNLQLQLERFEDASHKIEAEYKSSTDLREIPSGKMSSLQSFIDTYVDIRTRYHLRKEKLETWKEQGRLRNQPS